MAAEREALVAASQAVVSAPKASMDALCRSKTVPIADQKVLAAVRICVFFFFFDPHFLLSATSLSCQGALSILRSPLIRY